MRTFLSLCCGLSLAAIAVGCGGGDSEPAADSQPAGSDGKPHVALIMKSLANEFFSTMADGAEQHQQEHADEYQLTVNGIKDERDLARQVALVEEMVASGVDAIVIAPADSKALVPVLKRAQDEGIVVINIDNRLDSDVLADQGTNVPFVGPDNREGARKVADHLAGQLEQGDHVVVLEGIRTSFNGQQRRLGFEDAMQGAGIEIVDSQSAQWEMSQANQIASSMLSEHPDIKAILACNDSMALGAMAAVKAAGRTGEVEIIGFDNISAVQEAIREGRILATADQHGDQLAVYGIEYALKLLADPEATVEDRETPVDLITAEDLQ
ncbi:D-ribose-binding periplasmic protein precursor [Maioricimonas rarisocia]|uniref:D-ribose-binding periplasmic protein n=1 Tax=Maioricimonas rarisocia TaxID=2528026 RepID=A0A517ZFB8_9PLAN|nr:sugar ABC transporter substrate-binding protein [Maioricimonas rarisocia]QDU41187.1 D-ribose-binding periplasmic protein precursor [Maioricimonas rarisocia]